MKGKIRLIITALYNDVYNAKGRNKHLALKRGRNMASQSTAIQLTEGWNLALPSKNWKNNHMLHASTNSEILPDIYTDRQTDKKFISYTEVPFAA